MQVHRILNVTKALWANVFVEDSKCQAAEVLTSEYLRVMEKSITHKGKHWTADHYKKLHIIAKAIAMESSFEPLSWTRSGKDGIPTVLRPLVPYLKGDSTEKRFGLTITRSYELVVGKPEIKLEPITSPLTKPINQQFMSDFSKWITSWRESLVGKRIIRLSPNDRMHASPGVMGPNGPALLTSHIDAVAISRQPHLLKSVQFFSPFLAEQIRGLARKVSGYPDSIVSRIAFIAEGGMKTRTIAIGDYWTQNALRPLHDSLMRILKGLETDGTWNQNLQSERIRDKATDQAVSFDLTSATDRFPIQVQKLVIGAFYGNEVADHWVRLMTERDFQTPDKRTVRWAVGQPLGFYSSWAAFALTHHAIIEFCAFQEGIKSFRDYAVLGDDVVIWNSAVAARYEVAIDGLSVMINQTKTISSQTGIPRVEFAKRLFYKGTEISGISWGVISQASKAIASFVDLFLLAKMRSWEIPSGDRFRTPRTLSDKGKELFGVLYWERMGGEAPFPVNLTDPESLTLIRKKVIHLRLEKLLKLQKELDSILNGNKPMQDLFKSQGFEIDQSLLDYAEVMHPIVTHVNNMGMMVWDILEKLNDDNVNDVLNSMTPVLPIEFFPNMNTSLYFGDRKALANLFHSTLVWTAYYSLKEEQHVAT